MSKESKNKNKSRVQGMLSNEQLDKVSGGMVGAHEAVRHQAMPEPVRHESVPRHEGARALVAQGLEHGTTDHFARGPAVPEKIANSVSSRPTLEGLHQQHVDLLTHKENFGRAHEALKDGLARKDTSQQEEGKKGMADALNKASIALPGDAQGPFWAQGERAFDSKISDLRKNILQEGGVENDFTQAEQAVANSLGPRRSEVGTSTHFDPELTGRSETRAFEAAPQEQTKKSWFSWVPSFKMPSRPSFKDFSLRGLYRRIFGGS